jgi:formylglycine-generating enzyme required for sulfatase activity
MRIQAILIAALITSSLSLVTSCGGQKTNGADVGGLNEAVKITPGASLVTVGQTLAYSAQNVFGTDYAWSVIPESLGMFSGNGTFTAKAPGTGVVVATSRKDARYVGTTSIQTVPAPLSTVAAPSYVNTSATGLTASVPVQSGCTYAWTITGGTLTSAADGTQITFSAGTAPGTISISCTVSNAALTAVQGTAAIQVVSWPLVAAFDGLPTILVSGGATSLLPVFQGGTGVIMPGSIPASSGVAIPVTLTTTTTFVLTVTNQAGAKVSASASILVGDPNPPGGSPAAGTPWTDPATGLVLVWCPPGSFQMGAPSSDPDASPNEGPAHAVTFGQGFWISKSKVTQDEWIRHLKANPAFFQPGACVRFAEGTALPVEQVSWEDIQGYVGKINTLLGWSAFRLPSEAEWEYAYRAGTSTRFFWGEDPNLQGLSTYAWYKANAFNLTRPVNQLGANPWELMDIAGNVLEWTADTYAADYTGTPTDGSPMLENSSLRSLRGSAWNDAGKNLRASARAVRPPSDRFRTVGFRLVRPHRDAPVLSPLHASSVSLPKGGGSVTLSWTATGATSLWLDQGVGDVTGAASKAVAVTSSTPFTLLAKNANGWVMSTVNVEVAK